MPVSTSFFRGKTAFVFQAEKSSVGSLRENGPFFLSRDKSRKRPFKGFFLEKKPPFPVRKVDPGPKLWFFKKIKTTWRQHGTLESNPPILKSCNKTIHSKWIHGPRPALGGSFSQKKMALTAQAVFPKAWNRLFVSHTRFVWHSYDGRPKTRFNPKNHKISRHPVGTGDPKSNPA